MTNQSAHLLLVSRHDDVAGAVLSSAEDAGLSCDHISDLGGEPSGENHDSYDAVLVDVSEAVDSGVSELEVVRTRFFDEPVIFLGDDPELAEARRHALRAGAQDFVGLDHLTSDLLVHVVSSALGRQQFISDIERTREEAEAQATRQSIMAKISTLISRADDLQDVYQDIAEEVRRIMLFDRLALHLVDWDDETVTVHVMASGSESEVAADHKIPLNQTRMAEAAHSEGVIVFDRARLQRDAKTSSFAQRGLNMGFQAVVGAPLVSGDRRLGVLFAGSREEGLEAQANLDLLSDLAGQMAGPISRWVDRRAASDEQLRQSIAARIGEMFDVAENLDSIPTEVAAQLKLGMRFGRLSLHIVDWEAGAISVKLLDGERREIDNVGDTRTLADSPTERIALAGKIDVLTRRDIAPMVGRYASARWMLEKGFTTVLGAPLKVGGKSIGVLFASSFSDEIASSGNLKLMQAVADRIATPTARLVERQNTEKRTLRQEIVSKITRFISTANNLEDVYDPIAAELSRGMHFDRLAVHLVDWDRRTFTVHQMHGERHELDDLGAVRLLDESTTGAAAQADGVTVLTGDDLMEVSESMYAARWTLDVGYRTVVGAPLILGEQRIGVLYAASREAGLDDPANLELFQDVAHEIAGPIAQWSERRAAEHRALQESKLAAIASKLIQGADFDEAIRTALPEILDLVPCSTLILNVVNDGGETLNGRVLHGARIYSDRVNRSRPLRGTFTEHVMATKQAMLMDEVFSAPPDQGGIDTRALAAIGHQSGIAVPLVVDGEPIGSLVWLDYQESKYSNEDTSLATSIGMLVAGALANSELHRRTSQLLEETTRRLELEHENERLQVANEMKAQVISNVSHELRTPLTSMLAFADMLRRNKSGNLGEKELDQLDVIRRGGRQLELIINDLLTTSSVDSGAFELARTEFSLARLVDNSIRTMQPVLDSRSQSIERAYETTDEIVLVDPGRITQVLCNLISNASKYSLPDSEITVGIALRKGEFDVSVADSGPGVPPEMSEAVFDRYFRVDDESVRAQMGTGLGLHIAKTIVEAHKGELWLDTDYTGGARFVMRIPTG